ncbi:MAG: hypothetical protein HKP23_00895, partial [Flavobacteriaceae bacterium]|nr:hypothetical protein [Eudoraea sp.]NNJ37781.1 hypothetical protein [Flavobacteriaceae bacterium]
MRKYIIPFFLVVGLISCETGQTSGANAVVSVSISKDLVDAPEDGRLLLLFADNNDREPRFQINAGLNAQPV